MARKSKQVATDSPAQLSSQKIDGIDKYEVLNAADTLCRAEEIKNNPKLLKAACKVTQQKAKAAVEACGTINQAVRQAGHAKKSQGKGASMARKMMFGK